MNLSLWLREFDEISEEEMTNAIKFGHEAKANRCQNELVNEVGKKETKRIRKSLKMKIY